MLSTKDTLTLVVIGPKHAGKTVYLTALANSPGVSLSDPATIEVVSLHWKTLQDGKTPPATAGSIANLVFTFQCDMADQSYNVDFAMPDYDGHFAETLSKYEGNNDVSKLRDAIAEADGFIVFMPVGDDDIATMEELRHEIGSFVGILRKVYDEDAKVPAPLIIAVNKWDKSPAFKNKDEDKAALNYVESIEIYRLIYERLKSFFANVTVLPLSSYGHQTEDANPVPGAFAPYRVIEPIMLVVKAFFANLSNRVDREKESKDYASLARTLIGTEPLWKRWPKCNYSELLRETLQTCYDELNHALETASKRTEFDEIWNKSPQSAFVSYFTPAQQVELDHMREPLVITEKRQRLKKGGLAAGMLFVLAITWYIIHFHGKFNDTWLKASTAEAQNQYMYLHEFLHEYEGSGLARLLGSAKLETARQRLQNFVDTVQHNIDDKLAEIHNMPDSCKRRDEAGQLLDLAERLTESIPAQSMNRLNSLFKNSEEICSAKAKIEASTTIEQLEEAKNLLSGKADDEEVRMLKNRISEKSDRLLAEVQAQQEKERIAPIREEYDMLLRDEDISVSAVRIFIEQHAYDTNPDVEVMVASIREKLPSFFYTEIMKKIDGLKSLTGDDFGNLRTFISENYGSIELNSQQRANLRRVMQEKVERFDSAQINNIPDVINSQQALEAAGDEIRKCINIDIFNLDGGMFEYTRPNSLVSNLNKKIDIFNYHMDNLNNGIRAQWAVVAREKNAIKLDCDNLIALDARLAITFRGNGMPNQRPESTQSCKRIDGGGGYVFFYNDRVRPYNEGILLTKDRRFLDPLTCSSHLNITADDIIKLSNGRSLDFNLENNCQGISIHFSR